MTGFFVIVASLGNKSRQNSDDEEGSKPMLNQVNDVLLNLDLAGKHDAKPTYEELKNKGVEITPPEKQEWGGIMSKLKDQDGNSYSIISSPSSEQVALDSSS